MGASKTAGPVATGAVGIFVYHIRDQKQSLVFLWSVSFDYNLYDNWWDLKIYDGFIEADYDLYKEMYYGSPHKGDSLTYKGNLNFGWRYQGSMGHSGTPSTRIEIL
ncbi:3461_t:CDS:2 [Funneliformis mosseae]|uniref:3461_t:CDS:1 n=1 Tax=Funneliformis mosseae TaxID=27381 RepID=A0A9N9FVM2_FUNMO|nr:3461_t:CDS:2 [Funneliformis mosseae]